MVIMEWWDTRVMRENRKVKVKSLTKHYYPLAVGSNLMCVKVNSLE